jgi:hypothetical protein
MFPFSFNNNNNQNNQNMASSTTVTPPPEQQQHHNSIKAKELPETPDHLDDSSDDQITHVESSLPGSFVNTNNASSSTGPSMIVVGKRPSLQVQSLPPSAPTSSTASATSAYATTSSTFQSVINAIRGTSSTPTATPPSSIPSVEERRLALEERKIAVEERRLALEEMMYQKSLVHPAAATTFVAATGVEPTSESSVVVTAPATEKPSEAETTKVEATATPADAASSPSTEDSGEKPQVFIRYAYFKLWATMTSSPLFCLVLAP